MLRERTALSDGVENENDPQVSPWEALLPVNGRLASKAVQIEIPLSAYETVPCLMLPSRSILFVDHGRGRC